VAACRDIPACTPPCTVLQATSPDTSTLVPSPFPNSQLRLASRSWVESDFRETFWLRWEACWLLTRVVVHYTLLLL
jgi:hypothetical protein